MFDAIAMLLAWYYDIWPSYGGAIILLTLTIMMIVLPLTLKGTRSMMMQQALQPEIKRLQARYKDDRETLQQETLRLYRENNINPVGGCLPLIIQFPVFIVLYRVLHALTRIPEGQTTFDPGYISHDSALYRALDKSSHMYSWGLDLSESALEAMQRSFLAALPIIVLILAVAGSSLYQQKQIQGRNPNPSTINPQQQMIMKILPAFFAVFCIGLPTGLVIYFFISNLFRVAQQAFISHKIYKPAVAAGLFETKGKEADDGDASASGRGAKSGKGAKPALDKAPEAAPAKQTQRQAKSSNTHKASRSTSKQGGNRPAGGSARTGGRPPAGRPNTSSTNSDKGNAAGATNTQPRKSDVPAGGDAPKSLLGRLLGDQSKPSASPAPSSSDSARGRDRDRSRGRNGTSDSKSTPPVSTPPQAGGRVTSPGTQGAKKRKKRK